MSNVLKADLLALKSRLETIETQLEGKMKELDIRDEKWKRLEDQVNRIFENKPELFKLNIGGKKYTTTCATIMGLKDTLFYKMLDSKKFNINDEIFFDRSPKYFSVILDFIRNGKINYKKFKKEELEELKIEAEYYEIGEITHFLEEMTKDVEFIKMEYSGPYVYNGQTAGTDKMEDLRDKSLKKGVCCSSPGWIILELNSEWEIDEVQVGGMDGNSTLWYNANGAGASIQFSTDKVTWKTVGSIPSNYGAAIQTVKITKTSAKYVKFNHSTYLGIGFVGLRKVNN